MARRAREGGRAGQDGGRTDEAGGARKRTQRLCPQEAHLAISRCLHHPFIRLVHELAVRARHIVTVVVAVERELEGLRELPGERIRGIFAQRTPNTTVLVEGLAQPRRPLLLQRSPLPLAAPADDVEESLRRLGGVVEARLPLRRHERQRERQRVQACAESSRSGCKAFLSSALGGNS